VAVETAATNAAVATTAGQIVIYAGRPSTTYFFASSGGMTENVENAFLGSAPQPWLQGVEDPYNTGPTFDWKTAISFSAAAARLKGLVRGAFHGIAVLKRGVSPRIVSAEVLGSSGPTPLSGTELAERLGLSTTWAYFAVQDGRRVRPEPDQSSHPSATLPPSAATAPAEAQGGAQAPGTPVPAQAARTGGVAAG
jgi:stage II sporulation protein D